MLRHFKLHHNFLTFLKPKIAPIDALYVNVVSCLLFTVFISFYGLLPAIQIFQQKSKTLSRIETTQHNLSTNIDKLDQIKFELNEYQTSIVTLNRVMPDTDLINHYMVDVVVACSRAGYTVSKVDYDTQQPGVIAGTIIVTGRLDPSNVIKELESMQRPTKIHSMSDSYSDKIHTLHINMDSIYYGGLN